MGGIFGTISKKSCVADVFYGTDYNSHLGTRRGGLAMYSKEKGFTRSIHNLESSYFRTKFEPTLDRFEGSTAGIGVISDTDAQPLVINSHLGRFAICTVAKIANLEELTKQLLEKNMHFAELSQSATNQTELVALLIIQGKTFREGIENVFHHIKGSCTMMILTEDSIICARDAWGRTPIIIGKKDGAYAASSESSSFPNLDYEKCYNVGPGEIVELTADSMTQIRPANKKMQICSFLWVYYGFPTSTYEGKNVEEARFDNGYNLAKTDDVEVDCCSGIPDSGTGMAMGYAPLLIAFFRTAQGFTTAMYSFFSVAEFTGRTIGGVVRYRFSLPERKRFGFLFGVYQTYELMDACLLWLPYPLMLVNRALCGFLGIQSATIRQAAVQRYIPDRLRARLNAYESFLCTAAGAVLSLAIGALGEVLDYRLCMTICGLTTMLVCWLTVFLRRHQVQQVLSGHPHAAQSGEAQ